MLVAVKTTLLLLSQTVTTLRLYSTRSLLLMSLENPPVRIITWVLSINRLWPLSLSMIFGGRPVGVGEGDGRRIVVVGSTIGGIVVNTIDGITGVDVSVVNVVVVVVVVDVVVVAIGWTIRVEVIDEIRLIIFCLSVINAVLSPGW